MNQENAGGLTFSFVVPVYNEQDGLEKFHERLKNVAEALGEPYEIIFVNDGSGDRTGEIIDRLMDADRRVKTVEFSRNFGHQWAVTAGYDYAVGKAVVSLDADCQHPPELIPDMVAKWRDGHEVIYAVRKGAGGASLVRRAAGGIMFRLIRWASGVNLSDRSDFRLLDRKAVEALKSAREQGRCVRGLVNWIGFRQYALPYTSGKRLAGRSRYGLRQLMGMSSAGIYNFSVRPLRLTMALGVLLVVAAAAYAAVALAMLPFGMSSGPWAHVAAAMTGLFGLQFLMLGILGEYIGRIFEEAKDRPLYIVRRTVGFEKPKPQEPAKAAQSERRFAVYT